MTATPATVLTDEQAAQKLEQLKKRWNEKHALRIRAEGDVTRLRKEHSEACAEAAEKFGTDDLDQLRAMAVAVRTDNTNALNDFEQGLNEADRRLAEMTTNV